MDENKLGVYICTGCEIGDSVDTAALEELAEGESCRVHSAFCSPEGLQLIEDDTKSGTNRVLVAACSPRFKPDLFSFDGAVTERVNLRELVVWSHEPDDEDTQMLAEDYLRMGLAKIGKVQDLEPIDLSAQDSVLVVGGGVAGLSAASSLAGAGYEVVLVEKSEKLGGWAGKFSHVFSNTPPHGSLQAVDLSAETASVESHPNIKVFTKSTVESIHGQPGEFDVTVRNSGSSREHRVGAIIQATGWKPYEASRLGHLGYGQSVNVLTNVELEEILKSGTAVKRPDDGQEPQTVIFIQCAGSRDSEHLPYCSAVCCRTSMKQALQLRQLNPSLEVVVLYKDIRTPGQYEDLYRSAQEDPGILFAKAEVDDVQPAGEKLEVRATDTLLGKNIVLQGDLVILATGMVPNATDGEVIRKFKDAQKVVESGEKGAKLEAAQETVAELEESVGESILHLDYRQGPDTPTLRHQFPDSHFICFPYESRRTGIYMAGTVRAPGDIETSRIDGTGAALKALQSIELTRKGMAVHPRWGDMSYPDFSLQRCTQCKRCTEECPFGVLNEDAKGTPQPNPARCRRCGICLGACPERVISFKDYSIDIVSSMIKSVEIPDEFDEKPRLLGFLCENDAYPALDTAGLLRRKHSAYIRMIPVRCLGSINTVWIADALSRGFDGVLLVGCQSGDDYQCHFIRGSELMQTRGKNVREKLTQLALEEDRVRLEELSITEFSRLPAIINEFEEEIQELGLNPFKGF